MWWEFFQLGRCLLGTTRTEEAMALPANCSIPFAGCIQQAGSSQQQVAWRALSRKNLGTIAFCDASSSLQEQGGGKGISELKIGSAVIIVEAPPTLKTVNSISALRINAGLVKPGDVGRHSKTLQDRS